MVPVRPPSNLAYELRFRSHSGRLIGQHRALRRIDVTLSSWLYPILLPTFFCTLLWVVRDSVTSFWQVILAFWLERLELGSRFEVQEARVLGREAYRLSVPLLEAPLPGSKTLLAHALVIGSIMLVSYLTLRRRHLPLAYLAWALCLVHASALLFFALAPGAFPHTVASHLRYGLEFSLILAFLIPWLLAVACYPFDLSLTVKLNVTFAAVVIVLAFTPFQYALHAWLLHSLTLVMMPLLFVAFGPILNVVLFVAIYGWGMSQEY